MKLSTWMRETGWSNRDVADGLGTSRQYVSKWRKTNRVPSKWCGPLEKLTGGQVTAREVNPAFRRYVYVWG